MDIPMRISSFSAFPIGSFAFLTLAVTANAQAPAYTFHGTPPDDLFGGAIAGAGDVNNDGFQDVAVGAAHEASNLGRVRVFSGRDGSVLRTFTGQSPGENFGWSVAGAGDLNGDGCSELIVGAYLNGAVLPGGGRVYVISGTNGATLFTFDPTAANQQLGFSVSSAGDVNGDGVPDIIAGAPRTNTGPAQWTGMARVYSGSNGAVLYTFFGTSQSDQLGNSVAGAGDVNADGRADLIVGMFGSSQVGPEAGGARIYSGLDGSILFSLQPNSPARNLGCSVDGIGDVNGDGRDDVVVGAFDDNLNGGDSGAVFVFSGANGSALRTLTGSLGSLFGRNVVGAGDVDGDGVNDIFISSQEDSLHGVASGSVQAVSGASGGTLFTVHGDANFDMLGFSIGAAGDLNGDGRADLIAGSVISPGFPLAFSGTARVFLGACTAPVAYCTAKVNSAGCLPSMGSQGAPSVSIADGFTLQANNVLNQRPGLLLWSRGASGHPFAGGTLCLSTQLITRLGAQSAGGAPAPAVDCSGSYSVHFSQAYMAQKNLSPGMQVFAQFYSRDPGFVAPFNAGLTNAVNFTICP